MHCFDCGAPSPRLICENCARDKLWAAQYDAADNLTAARIYKLSTYWETCGAHGVTLWETRRGRCLACNPPVRGGARALARAAGARVYEAECLTHGRTAHAVAHGGCLTCRTTTGAERVRGGARALARAAGATSYAGTCPKHGDTACSVRHGRCLTCYSEAGRPRQWVKASA